MKTFKCSVKTTFDKKKYEIRVIVKATVLAPDNSAIVLIDETVKIFSLKKREYKPTV